MSNARSRDARLLESNNEVEELARALAGEDLVAVDTEADSFHSYFDKVCLVQISTCSADYIIDPLAADDLSPLSATLADPAVACVLHGADYDLRILDRDHGLRIRGLFDTMVAARLLGYQAFGLASLLDRHFGLKIPKAAQRADWSRRPLTAQLLSYAAGDTHYLPELHDLLRGELQSSGRLSWAQEEFSLLEEVRHEPRQPDPEAFRKIKGCRDLDRTGLAVVRELHAWREECARQRDRAPFRVLGNATLVELARRRPTRLRELAGIPGMPRNLPEAKQQELLEAVSGALGLPEEDLPPRRLPSRGRRVEPDPGLPKLKKLRDSLATEIGLDPGLVAPNAVLEHLLRLRPRTGEELLQVPGLRRWQAGLVGAALIEALKEGPDGGKSAAKRSAQKQARST